MDGAIVCWCDFMMADTRSAALARLIPASRAVRGRWATALKTLLRFD
jgi:hypothetical protein